MLGTFINQLNLSARKVLDKIKRIIRNLSLQIRRDIFLPLGARK